MNDKILNILNECRNYILAKGVQGLICYRNEQSNLLRIAESESSLNTSENKSFFGIELQKGKQVSSGSFTSDVSSSKQLFTLIDSIFNSLEFMPVLNELYDYLPIEKNDNTLSSDFDISCENNFSDLQKNIFKESIDFYGTDNAKVSGIFTSGISSFILMNTMNDNYANFLLSDFQIKKFLSFSNRNNNYELSEEITGESYAILKNNNLFSDLKFFYNSILNNEPVNLDSEDYDVVFSASAMSELIKYFCYIALSGERMELGASMLNKDVHKFEDKIFGENFTLYDAPEIDNLIFRKNFGMNGIIRKNNVLFDEGKFSYLYYSDRKLSSKYGKKINNDISSVSLQLKTGNGPSSFDEIFSDCSKKILFVNELHYMNIVNISKGEITSTARFGTFLINQDGMYPVKNNIRITDSFFNLFNNIEWLSKNATNVNVSNTYSMRFPVAIQSPTFTKINNVKITAV